MELLAAGWLILGTACATLALVHATVWLRGDRGVSRVWIAVASFAAAGNAFTELWMSRAETVEEFSSAFEWSNRFIALMLVGLAWFTVSYSGTRRRWLAWVATIAWGLVFLIALAAPHIAFGSFESIVRVTLPWGESATVGQGTPGIGKILHDSSVLAIVALIALAVAEAGRRGRSRHAVVFGGILFFLITGVTQAGLVDFGIIATPYLISYLFAAIILVTSYELAGEVASAAVLADEVRSSEHRWRSLMENVQLLVVGCDPEGRIDYVNPFLCEVSGYQPSDLVGRPCTKLLRDRERVAIATGLETARDGKTEAHLELPIVTQDKKVRDVFWSNVLRRDAGGRYAGTLSVGVDVTAQRAAEAQRDSVTQSLQEALARVDALKARLEEENLYLKQQIELEHSFSNIVGGSDGLKYVLHRVEQVADAESTVLILGETGVGKELIARAVHESSRRADRAFVRVNCAALPATLIESELFGHEKGAFTGADRTRKGRFELADGGTLFLDEVGELAPELQSKLLRVLDHGEFERIGGTTTRTVDIRLIAATNRDLEAEVAASRFRRDLFYRLHVYPITVPPLRQRRDDVRPLVNHFVRQIASGLGRTIEEVPPAVMHELERYDWPGNVRELRNVLERAVITSPGTVLRLPEPLGPAAVTTGEGSGPVRRTLEEVERAHILAVLRLTQSQIGGRGGAAEILGIPASTLRSRMKKLGLRFHRSTESGPDSADH